MVTRALLVLLMTATPAAAIELELPIDCTPGKDCFLQNYVDWDKGPGMQDYACGAETYDGHDGTDIRLRSVADVDKGVAVLAAAPGVVVGIRDGKPDRLVRSEDDRAAVGNQECGNGVRIDHGGEWATQYCHMRRGSVAVKVGEHVKAGTKLGEVGYSGMAAFPHMHISVSQDMTTVDPFLADDGVACGADGPSLWSNAAKAKLTYQRGALLGLGITDHAVTLVQLEDGAKIGSPSADTPAVAYMWAINLEKGDTLDVALKKDGDVVVNNTETLDRSKAQMMLFAGKKAPQGGWPKGRYTAQVTVMRDGKPVISEETAPVVLD